VDANGFENWQANEAKAKSKTAMIIERIRKMEGFYQSYGKYLTQKWIDGFIKIIFFVTIWIIYS